MRSSNGLTPKTCSSSRPLPARPQSVPIAGRQGLQNLCSASRNPHGGYQQLYLCARPLQQSHTVKHIRPATSLAAAAQEQPVAADPAAAVAADADAAPSSSIEDHDSNGTDAQQQQQQAESSSSEVSDSTTEAAPAAPAISIKVLSEPGELTAVARLRAEAYYEVSSSSKDAVCGV